MNVRARGLLALFLILSLPILGCGALDRASNAVATLTATEPAPGTTPESTSPPTPIPPAPAAPATLPPLDAQTANSSAILPLIDAAGLDFAERRNIEVYQRVSPSVVNITTQVMVRNFFDVVPEEGAGSGFVLDHDGHILTNFHVVDGAQQISVAFGGDSSIPATVVGVDPRNDLAVLHVDLPADSLQPVDLGVSADLRVGQWAIAIGNPFGQFDRTLTTGVISALNRTLQGSDGRTITGVIQTDAAINKGNSGGPLLDSSGRVIGINSAIFSPTGSNAGVGFAVPVDTIKRVLPDLLKLGYYRHPWMGLQSAYTVTPDLAQALNLPVKQGILVVQLQDGSPLETAGVRGAQQQVFIGNQRAYVGGDIMTAVDGQGVTAADALDAWLETNFRVGDAVTVQINRDGAAQDLQITLGEEPR